LGVEKKPATSLLLSVNGVYLDLSDMEILVLHEKMICVPPQSSMEIELTFGVKPKA
jgi:hypothetical protein